MFCLSMFDLLGLDSLPSAVLCSRARKNNPIGIISTLAAGSIRGFCNDAKLKAPSRRNRQPKETETRDEVQQHSRSNRAYAAGEAEPHYQGPEAADLREGGVHEPGRMGEGEHRRDRDYCRRRAVLYGTGANIRCRS